MEQKIQSKFGFISTLNPEHCLISKSILHYGEWAFHELDLIKKLIRNEGDIIDIGAHIGYHSLEFSNFIGDERRVFSIEGNKDTFKVLCQNTVNASNIVTINRYLSEKSDKEYCEVIEIDNLGSTKLAETKDRAFDKEHIVRTTTVDDLDLKNICLIKSDAEGFDARILNGAKRLLKREKPTIIAEANCITNLSDMYSLMVEEEGYYCYFFCFEPLNRRNFNANQIDIYGPGEKEGSIAFTPEKIEEFHAYEVNKLEDLIKNWSCRIEKYNYNSHEFSQRKQDKIATLLAIPFFKNEHLVSEMFDSLYAIREELKQCSIEILLINDSPSYLPLKHALDSLDVETLRVPCEIMTNKENLGYLLSANLAIDKARINKQHLILLNSDARPSPNCIAEMLNIFDMDTKIGFVAPRSNKCSISTIPVESMPQNGFKKLHNTISQKYNRYTFSPVSPGFMLLVKDKVISQFGNLSIEFSPGYEEENDWQLRSGKAGWRSVLANWAYANHEGSVSFSSNASALSVKHSKVIQEKHPHYPRLLEKYNCSASRLSDELIANSESKTILISCPNMNEHHDGTSRHAKELIQAFASNYGKSFEITVLAKKNAIQFHKLDEIACIDAVTTIGAASSEPFSTTRRFFEFGLMIGQPFQREHLHILRCSASVIGIHMLDCICLDVPELYTQLDSELWQCGIECSDSIFVNSEYTRKLFINRYNTEFIDKFRVNYPSLNPFEYIFETNDKSSILEPKLQKITQTDFILVMGNKFPHKNLIKTAEALASRLPELSVIAIGAHAADTSSRVKYLPSGYLSDNLLDELFSNANSIVFPSYYEGFGFPIMHALEHSKNIFVRDYELNHELKNILQTDKIVMFNNYDDLASSILEQKGEINHWHAKIDYGWRQVSNDILLQLTRNKDKLKQAQLIMKLESLLKVPITKSQPQHVSLRYSLAKRLLQFRLINIAYKTTIRVEKILGLEIISYIRRHLKV